MKIPKNFFYFLAGTQVILTLSHWAMYVSLIFFFPAFLAHKYILLAVLILLSLSFLGFSILDFKYENAFVRIGYIISGVWIVSWFYLLLASVAASIVFIINDVNYPHVTLGLFIIALLVSAYGAINARIVRTVDLKIKLPNLPDYWKGKTGVLASDFHLGHVLRAGFANKVIAKINALNPEIVFIPGDYFDGVKTDFAALANLLKGVKSPQGIYFCSGNHELFAGYKECEDALRAAGIKILENEKIEVAGLQIAGAAYDHDKMHDAIDNFASLLANMQLDKNKPSILLKHVPLQMEEVRDAGISLQLSGHTHRGQTWPGSLVTKKFWKGYDYGLKSMGKLQIYISSGVGTWGPPMRINSQSEIVKITFE